MADAKLSELTTATLPAAGTDLLYLVQGVNSRKITLDNLNASAANVNMKSRVQLGSASTITTAGQSIGVTTSVTHLNSTDGPGRIFIPSGFDNQVKVVTMTVYGGDYWINSNISNNANLLFSNVGDSAVLIYSNNSWNILGKTSSNSIFYYNDTLAYANTTLLGYATNAYIDSSLLTKANVADLDTSNVVEGANLYFTNARVYSNIIELGYTTNAYVNVRLDTKANIADLTTANVSEGSNLYFTNARVYDNVITIGYATTGYVDNAIGNISANGLAFTNGAIISGDSNVFGTLNLGLVDYPINLQGPTFVNDYGYFTQGILEKFTSITNATSVVTHNCSNSHIFNHTTPSSNWTVNLTNLPLFSSTATSITLIINQGATGYYANALQIGGTPQTIKWLGNTLPTANSYSVDIQTFSIFLTGASYTVLGQLTSFG